MALPRLVVFQSAYNSKYLNHVNEDGPIHNYLQFSGENMISPWTKFEIETAESVTGLVHIRSCYNNKYWGRSSESKQWITVNAGEREEDQSKWSCTLFKPIFVDSLTIRLVHVQLGNHACLWRGNPPEESCIIAAYKSDDNDSCDVFKVTDWESLMILPKHIAFKGDNGCYLRVQTIKSHPYNQFVADDLGDPTVGYEVFTNHDGSVRIKSDYYDRFWRRSPNWIWADTDDTSANNPDTLFWPLKISNNVVALRNLGNNNFCCRYTDENKTSCLNAAVSTISKSAQLQVEELVISRQIYDVQYRLMDARIYDQLPLELTTGESSNLTNAPITSDILLSYTDTSSTTWNSSASLKLGFTDSFTAGVPAIAEEKITISSEFVESYSWGETKTTTTKVDTKYSVTIPPMSKVTVRLLATKGTCDVPFSYTQRDTLTNGQQVASVMDDGIFTGINSYNLTYAAEQEDLGA